MHLTLPRPHPFLSICALLAALAVGAAGAEPEPALPDELKALPAGTAAAETRMPTPRQVVDAIRRCYAADLLQNCRDNYGPETVEALLPLLGQVLAIRAKERVLYDLQAAYLERIALGQVALDKARPLLEKAGAGIAEHAAAQARLLDKALHGPEGVHHDAALARAGRVRGGTGRRGWRATSHPPARTVADPFLRNKVALLHRLSDEAETMLTCAPWESWAALYEEGATRHPFLKWENQALVLVDPEEDARDEAASHARIAAAAERAAAAAARRNAKLRHEADRRAANEATRARKAQKRADEEAERLATEAAERKAEAAPAQAMPSAVEPARRDPGPSPAPPRVPGVGPSPYAAPSLAVANPPSPPGAPEAMRPEAAAPRPGTRHHHPRWKPRGPRTAYRAHRSLRADPEDMQRQAERAQEFAMMNDLAARFAEMEVDRQRLAEQAAIHAALTTYFHLQHLQYLETHPYPHPFAPFTGPLPTMAPPPAPAPATPHRLSPLAPPFKPAGEP